MKRSIVYMAVFIFSSILISGCGFDRFMPKPSDPSNPIKRIAILPIQNDTTDIEGPDYVRNKLVDAFQDRQYNVKPVADVDRLLRDKMGATLGGQLTSVKPKILKDILDVEGVVFGTLMDFDETTTGVYNVRKVRGKFKLVNCLNGETFWENGIGIKSQDSTGGIAGKATTFAAEIKDSEDKDVPWEILKDETLGYGIAENFARSLGKKLFSKVTDSHLEKETGEMVKRITGNLPYGPGTSAASAKKD